MAGDREADESAFWRDEHTSVFERISQRLPRLPRQDWSEHHDAPRPAGARSHSDTTGSVPVVPTVQAAADRVRGSMQHVDPLLRRLGAIAILITLCVPVAISMRAAPDRAPLQVTAAGAEGTTTADAEVAATTAASQPLDPKDLPPATPVPGWDDAAGAVVTQDGAAPSDAAVAPNSAAATAPVSSHQSTRVEAAACAKTYTVVAGDGWIYIARKVSVDVSAVLSANGATASTPLYPGKSICLPANVSAPTTVAAAVVTAKPVTATTKPPTTTVKPPPPTTAAPARTYTKAQVEAIIREVWPDELEAQAVSIATRESNLIPTAQNYCCSGLFQLYWNVHKGWLATIGVTSQAQLYDPRVNAYAAYVLYLRSGGFGPWL